MQEENERILKGIGSALKRASFKAREVARKTETAVVITRGEKIVDLLSGRVLSRTGTDN